MNADSLVVPYVAAWSGERTNLTPVIVRPDGLGIAYADEVLGDRDNNGILWARTPSRPGHGKPEFGSVHSSRQRRAMRKLLCQVCACPADHTDDGVLWVLEDHRDDWPGWPERMGVTEPPICPPCLRLSVRACPALRRGHAIFRVRHAPIAGIRGTRYRPGRSSPAPIGNSLLPLDDPGIHWTLAAHLVRELHDCTILDI